MRRKAWGKRESADVWVGEWKGNEQRERRKKAMQCQKPGE